MIDVKQAHLAEKLIVKNKLDFKKFFLFYFKYSKIFILETTPKILCVFSVFVFSSFLSETY